MTLREINEILLDLAEPYKQSPTFEKFDEPIASDDDSSMTLKVYFNEQIITITCDGEGNIDKKTRKRKLTAEQEDALYGHQMSLFDTAPVSEPVEDSDDADLTIEKAVEKPVTKKKPEKKETLKVEPRELKTKVTATDEPKSPFTVGDIVCSIYDNNKQYIVDGISGYIVRCKIIGQLDACYMTSSDLMLVANQHGNG